MTDKEYDVLSIEKGWYRIVDETNEDYLYPPELFEVVEKIFKEDDNLNLTAIKAFRKLSPEKREKMIKQRENEIRERLKSREAGKKNGRI